VRQTTSLLECNPTKEEPTAAVGRADPSCLLVGKRAAERREAVLRAKT